MDALGDWLRPLVEAALSKCLSLDLPEGREYIRYQKLQPSTADADVQVFTLRDTRCLQITKWRTSEPPYHAVISDSYTRIKASFSRDAIQNFVIELQKPLARGTRGAIITVHEFDLIITCPKEEEEGHDNDDDESDDDDDDHNDHIENALTIVIKDFELEGSEGSREFGKPQNMTAISSIRTLLRRLFAQRKRQGTDHGIGPVNEKFVIREDVTIPHDQEKTLFRTQAWQDSFNLDSEPPVPLEILQRWDNMVFEHVREKMDMMSVDRKSPSLDITSSMPLGSQEKPYQLSDIESQLSSVSGDEQDHQESDDAADFLPPDTP